MNGSSPEAGTEALVGHGRTTPRRPLNVVIVTVDCMRRDRLSAYGYPRSTTPFLDGLLDNALHCTSAHSVSSWTCPSVVSLMTGLYPHRHGGGLVPSEPGAPKNLSKQNLPTRLSEDIATLPGMLAAAGYSTAAMIAVWNAHLPMPGRFDEVAMMEKPGSKVVRRGLRWAREQDRPFLLWLHLGDVHEPLDVPRSKRDLFGRVPKVKKALTWDYTKSADDVGSPAFQRYRDARTTLYDVAVRSSDDAIAELWAGLDAMGERDRTLLVVTADHGEEFWEHRDEEMASFTDPRDVYGTGHGHNLFQVHLLVPLVLTGPGIEAGRHDENVSLIDVMPTVMDAIGLDPPPMDGRSLLDGAAGPGDRPILAEGIAYGHEKRSVVAGDLKLLSSPEEGYEQVFRLGPDRTETEAVEDPEVADRLRRHLPGGASAMGEQVEATEEIVEHLKALGYIE
jgi:arylsulfatase A-like enzyme